MKHHLPRGQLLLLAATIFGSISAATAAEGGSSNYPAGALSSYAALMPAPGTSALYGYVVDYPAYHLIDNDGKAVPDAHLNLAATAPRVVHSWDRTWAGFTLSSGGVIELARVAVSAGGHRDTSTGTTLLGIEPLYLSRSFGTLHLLTGPVAYLPLGSYKSSNLANSTAAYTSYAYQFSATWMPTPLWDVSLATAAEFKDRNKQTRYRSGTQGHLTYGLSYRPFDDTSWQLGVTGYYSDQLGDDRSGSAAIPGGGRTRRFAVGPKIAYWFTPATTVIFQWHHESQVRNAPRGDLYWIEFGLPI